MGWFDGLPESIAFIDVETTGLTEDDRVVSIGAIWLATADLCDQAFPTSTLHLIFNPERPSHVAASKIHGYSDGVLSQQDKFSTWAPQIGGFLSDAKLVVAHNANFDCGFVNRELSRAGLPEIGCPVFCTMAAAQNQIGVDKLENICREMGVARRGHTHCAAEDAWLCMTVYLRLHGCPYTVSNMPSDFANPLNIHVSQTATLSQPQSNTGRASAATPAEASRIDSLVSEVKRLKRLGDYGVAEGLLLAEVERQEAVAASRADWGVAPWYYDQLAIIYAKTGKPKDELAILERYDGQPKAPGSMPVVLKEKMEKCRRRRGQKGSSLATAIRLG